jgi:hypothetical protein
MKKIILTMCFVFLAAGMANANPPRVDTPHHNQAPREQRVVQQAPPPVVPVVYQVPAQVPTYSSGYPSVTFSNRYFDVTVGL